MKKKMILFFVSLVICFMCLTNVKAGITDFSGGASGSVSGLGSGAWYPEFVGLKISIVDENNKLEDVEIFLNKKTDFLEKNANLCSIMKPKTHYGSTVNIKWTSKWKDKVYINGKLPSSWLINNEQTNIYNELKGKDEKYTLLLEILNTKASKTTKVFETLDDYLSKEHYIIVEPMTYIGGYYGTAFELINAFAGNVRKCDEFFCYWYTGAVFGGNSNKSDSGVLYDTIFVSENVKINDLIIRRPARWMKHYIPGSKESLWIKRNRCLKSKSCGGALGVFKYDDMIRNKTCKQHLKDLGKNPSQKQLNDLYEYYLKKGKDYNQLLETRVTSKPTCSYKAPTNDPKLDCDSELSKLGENPQANQLFSLYKDLIDKGIGEYKGLLDFENPSCDNPDEDERYTNSCMSANHGNNNMDFSFSTPKNANTLTGGVSTIYCKNVFQLSNQRSLDDLVKSGMLFYSSDGETLEDSVAMEGELTQICYSPDRVEQSSIPFSDYGAMVQNMSVGNLVFNPSVSSNPIEEVEYGGGYLYKKGDTVKYSNPNVYAVIGSGEIADSLDDPKCITINGNNICEKIGQGFVTNFNSVGNITLAFKYKYNGNNYELNYDSAGVCTIDTYPELPLCNDDGKNCNLNLEFRTIDTSNPFPGKKGVSRNVGSNWCGQIQSGEEVASICSGIPTENNVIETHITNKNNSYNKTNEGPKYTIKLTPSTIKDIRDDNKETSYDDINLKCENDVCISNYLTDLKNDGLLTINNSENRKQIKE